MEIQWTIGDEVIKENYWSEKLSLEEVNEKGKECDVLRIWYPWNIDERIYERYNDRLRYIEFKGRWKGKAYSSIINLKQSETEIMNHFSKTRKYEMRRAMERDKLHIDFYHPQKQAECNEFFHFYNAFARSKNMSNIVKEKAYALMENNMLVIAKISSAENEILVMHGYIIDKNSGRVALYTSSSLFREKKDMANLIGRANGWLHYQSMLYFKNRGFSIYDFGGIYRGDDNIQLKNITQYKMSFGGELVEFDNSVIIPFRIIRGIDSFLDNYYNLFMNKKLIIWGAAQNGKYLINRLNKLNIKISSVIDNKLAEENSIYFKDNILIEYEPSETIIVVTTSVDNYHKIIKQDNCVKYVESGCIICMDEEIRRYAKN